MTELSRRNVLAASAAAVAGAASTTGTASAGSGNGQSCPHPPVVTVRPDDIRYPDLVRGTNLRWVGTPDYVRLVSTPEQVVDVVRDAVRAGQRLTVRSGGHCYLDWVFNPAVDVVVDTSPMAQIYYDEKQDAIAVEAGASLLDIYETLYRIWGVTIPGGSCYSVGAGGHICGGGYGLLSRQFGLTVDYLHAVEVVVVDTDGEVRRVIATREHHPELLWAHTGGGGGNFGVITRYWLRDPTARSGDTSSILPNPPSEVLVSVVSWPWSGITERSFGRLLTNFGGWLERNSAPGSPYAALFGSLKVSNRANGEIGLVTQVDATVPNAERMLDEFLTAVNEGVGVDAREMNNQIGLHGPLPQFQPPQRLPWLHATQWLSGSNPTLRGDYKSAYMRRNFPADQVAAMYRNLTLSDYTNTQSLIEMDSYGCQVNAVPSAATAAQQRDSVIKLQYQAYWEDPADADANIAWLRRLYQDVYGSTGGVPVPNEITDGCYINYPDADLSDPRWNRSEVPWYTLYYKEAYPRLQAVKARWDPTNFFRHGQSVRPD